jgi:glutathione S-transferase
MSTKRSSVLFAAIQPRQRAMMAQVISIIDAYGYVPMMRQVFSQRVFGLRIGSVVDEAQVREGIEGATRVLDALENIAMRGGPLVGVGIGRSPIFISLR